MSNLNQIPEFLKLLLNSTQEGITLWDFDANLLYFNKQAKVITNLDLELGTNLRDYKSDGLLVDVDGRKITQYQFPLLNTIRERKRQAPQRFGISTKQTTQWIENSTDIITYEGVEYIISKFSEISNLVESEGRFHDTFNYAPIGISLVSTEGLFLKANPALCAMLGYTETQIIQKGFQEITHPKDLDTDLEEYTKTLTGEKNSYSIEKRYIHKDGHFVHAQLHVYLVRKNNGEPNYFISQIVDISELKTSLLNLDEKNRILNETSDILKYKITQLEEFSQIVAHNLRSVAGNISSTIEVIQDTDSFEEQKEFIELLKHPSKTLLDTLGDVMDIIELQDKDTLEKQTCDITATLNRVKTQLSDEILNKKAEIIADFEFKTIEYAKVYLDSILYNLISNSLKYAQENTIPSIKIRTYKVGLKNFLEVIDNGIGINLKRHQNNLFKYRKTFHQNEDSKGMGLFLVKNQVEAMGGKIHLDSTVGVGTKVIIEL